MTSESPEAKTHNHRKWPKSLLIGFVFIAVACAVYIRTHPLVFNESLLEHAHCIAQVGLGLNQYALDHFGKFPAHTNGYGDALLLMLAEGYESSYALSGPGYDRFVFDRALTNHTDVPEIECGRVYVQGLSATSNPELVLLFDKLPTPGGDHCHLLKRLWAPLGREIWIVGDGHKFIKETAWPEFARNQVELLVKEGFSRTNAEALYSEKGRVR